MNLKFFLQENRRVLLAFLFLVVIFFTYLYMHPRGFTTYVLTIWANQGVTLAFAAMAQCLVVLVRGIDLSVGPMIALCNAVASHVLVGNPFNVALGVVLVILTGAACGLMNGLLVVVGRIQPIVATLASGAVFTGLALFLRPQPGGKIDEAFSDALTYAFFGIPTSLIVLAAAMLLIWVPLRRHKLGLYIYAVGSNENAAFLSAIDIKKTQIAPYILAGCFASFAGLYVSLVTLTGDATIGPSYTLNSIAAIVIGGVALSGGVGGLMGAIVGAFVLRTVTAVMFFSGLPPLAQPFFEGLVLAIAIGVGALGILKIRNKTEIFGK